jgi:hypothetical protein
MQSVIQLVGLLEQEPSLYQKQSAAADAKLPLSGIIDYFAEDLDAGTKQNLLKRIESDGSSLAAALDYALYRAELHPEQRESQSSQRMSEVRQQSSSSNWLQALSLLFGKKLPAAWVGVPAFAVLVLAVLVLIEGPEQVPAGDVVVVSYRDNPDMEFRAPNSEGPGVGFFSEKEVERRPYGGVQVSVSAESKLTLRWASVPKVDSYDIALFLVDNGQRSLLARQQVSGELMWHVPNHRVLHNKRYEWELSGKTVLGERFKAQGGFVATLR